MGCPRMRAHRFYAVRVRRLPIAIALLFLTAGCATDDGRTLRDPVFDPPGPPTTTLPSGGVLPNLTKGVGGLAISSPAFLPGDPIPSGLRSERRKRVTSADV